MPIRPAKGTVKKEIKKINKADEKSLRVSRLYAMIYDNS